MQSRLQGKIYNSRFQNNGRDKKNCSIHLVRGYILTYLFAFRTQILQKCNFSINDINFVVKLEKKLNNLSGKIAEIEYAAIFYSISLKKLKTNCI